jgi:hypothetical protein
MNARSELSRTATLALASVALLSAVAFVLGGAWDMQRVGAGLLVASCCLVGVGLGAAVLLALLFVTGARWSDHVRPGAERMTRLLPFGAAGIALVLVAFPSLYPWSTGPSARASAFQVLWLSRPFFLMRAATYLALWLGLTTLLIRASRQTQTQGTGAAARISAVFLVVFALTSWLASADWIMSLEPRWSSSVFGIYNFAGSFLSAIAAVAILATWLDHVHSGTYLTRAQRRDIATLLFGFSSFWMYIWFSQYLLIWYVNNPEEADYYVLRQQYPWQPLVLANIALNWGVPFLVLLYRPAKESATALLCVAMIVLVGRWLDLSLMILPPVLGSTAVFGVAEAGLFAGTVGLAVRVLAPRLPLGAATGVPGEVQR